MYSFDPEAAVRIALIAWFVLGFLLWPLHKTETRLYYVLFFPQAVTLITLGEIREFVRRHPDILSIIAAILIALWLLGSGN